MSGETFHGVFHQRLQCRAVSASFLHNISKTLSAPPTMSSDGISTSSGELIYTDTYDLPPLCIFNGRV